MVTIIINILEDLSLEASRGALRKQGGGVGAPFYIVWTAIFYIADFSGRMVVTSPKIVIYLPRTCEKLHCKVEPNRLLVDS